MLFVINQPMLICTILFICIYQGFNLTSWQSLNNFGSTLTPEETKFLWREIGIEDYVGVGCSRSAPPQNHSGWQIPTSKII